MKAVILLSPGRHPVSGTPAPVPVEAQAIRLAAGLSENIRGLHAGPDGGNMRDYLGLGLGKIVWIDIPAQADPLPALLTALTADMPELILAGNRGQGGEDSGLLPYRIAQALGWPIISDAIDIACTPGQFTIIQALPRGARRRIVVARPALVTVHRAAPDPRPFSFAAARRGSIDRIAGEGVPPLPAMDGMEERPYRARPKMIGGGGGSAAERLKAATELSGQGGNLLIDPDPATAAAAIAAHLAALGLIPAK